MENRVFNAEYLRRRREKSGMTKVQLAARLGVNELSVRWWESGDRDPTLVMLVRLAKHFGCPISKFVKPEAIRGEN